MLKNIDIQNYRAIKQISLNNFANINIFTGKSVTLLMKKICFLLYFMIIILKIILK